VELHAGEPRSRDSNAATGVCGVEATTVKPGGASTTASPCDIQTDCCAGRPWKSVFSAGVTASGVPPYSRDPVRATVPPSAWAIAWKP
jgi:hypothetical protein